MAKDPMNICKKLQIQNPLETIMVLCLCHVHILVLRTSTDATEGKYTIPHYIQAIVRNNLI